MRPLVAGLVIWAVVSPLSWYPHFLSFTSEYVRSRDGGHRVLLDSNLDWGQGLRTLREYLDEARIGSVYLSYFGSALPEGYCIRYRPLPSFLPLPERPLDDSPLPTHVVVSATNLHGLYLDGDPFAALRGRPPDRVIAHTLFVYPLPPAPREAGGDTAR